LSEAKSQGAQSLALGSLSAGHLVMLARESRQERSITALFELCSRTCGKFVDERLPVNREFDSIVYEMKFKVGRADIVVFHADGSATVIEVKNGDRGAIGVMAGMGQVTMYAAQLAIQHRGALTRVRKALLWTSTGDALNDALIEHSCLKANVIPLPWGLLSDHLNILRTPEELEAAA